MRDAPNRNLLVFTVVPPSESGAFGNMHLATKFGHVT